MIINELSLNENLEQNVPKKQESFPHTVFYAELQNYRNGVIPWHWHEDIEFFTVIQGKLRLSTNNESYVVSAGEGAFINTNIMHLHETLSETPVILISEVFNSSIISGGYLSIFEQKYISPVLENQNLEVKLFKPSSASHRRILELLRQSQDAAELEAEGFEFTVRNCLSSVWQIMFQEISTSAPSVRSRSSQGSERIKKMMLFIREHYPERLSLSDIAAAANISERECLRCFQNNLNTTPFTYLLRYRCRAAAERLKNSEDSITDIAYICGFSGSSYFGKIFRQEMGCSPSAYRRENHR